jgi:hypothetical protein
MLKTNAGPEFRPKRQLSAQIAYTILILGIVVLVYCFVSAARRESVHRNLQKQHAGKQIYSFDVSKIVIHTNTESKCGRFSATNNKEQLWNSC